MKNNKGFGKFEILSLFVLCLAFFAYLMYMILGKAGTQKFVTMKENAVSLSKVVSTNKNSFHNSETIYLGEVIDEEFSKKVKSPFTSGYCDEAESKVQYIDGNPYVTLRCDEYLIDKSRVNDINDIVIYKVSDWYDKQKNTDGEEANVLYNCLDENGKEMFDKYIEEYYLISRVNKEFDTDYYGTDGISECEVVSKTMYRTKTEK